MWGMRRSLDHVCEPELLRLTPGDMVKAIKACHILANAFKISTLAEKISSNMFGQALSVLLLLKFCLMDTLQSRQKLQYRFAKYSAI